MSHRPAIRTLLCALLLYFASSLTGRSAGAPQESKTSRSPATTNHKTDACTLLTSAELQAAIGEPLQEARSSVQPAAGMRMSQCFFRMPTSAKSVSLSLATQGRGSSPSALREFWRNQFQSVHQDEERDSTPAEKGKTPSGSEAERESDARKPRPIEGLGDEAFWVGSAISGALYVLQGDAFLRVSVGGIPEEPSRLAKSKVLARAAIARLRSSLPTAASNLRK
jgi:hypothetical protein